MQRRAIVIAGSLMGAAVTLPPLSKETIMNTVSQETALAQRLIDLHFAIWNDTDKEARFARFAEAYNPDFFVADYAGKAGDYLAVNQLIERVQSQHPGFVFRPDPIAWNHGLGRVTWNYGPSGQPAVVHGEDIFTVSGGRLSSAYVFLDKP